jgi:hypothetical protein
MTYSDGDSGLVVQVFQLVHMSGEKGLFDEEWSVRLKQLGQLFRHTLMYSTVEVTATSEHHLGRSHLHLQSDIETDRLDLGETLDCSIESMGRVKPSKLSVSIATFSTCDDEAYRFNSLYCQLRWLRRFQ